MLILIREYTQKLATGGLMSTGLGLATLGIALRRADMICERFELFLYCLAVLFMLMFITRCKTLEEKKDDKRCKNSLHC